MDNNTKEVNLKDIDTQLKILEKRLQILSIDIKMVKNAVDRMCESNRANMGILVTAFLQYTEFKNAHEMLKVAYSTKDISNEEYFKKSIDFFKKYSQAVESTLSVLKKTSNLEKKKSA